MTAAPLTDLQLDVMKALWRLGEGTLAEVQGALADDGKVLAPTTVATLLQRMAKQGWVATRKLGRQFVYRPGVAQHDAARGALQRVVRGFFGGSVSAMAAHLLDAEPLSADELEAMRRLLDAKEP